MARKAAFRIYGDYPDLMAVPAEIKRKAMPRIVAAGKKLAQQEAPKRRGLSSKKSIASRIGAFVEKTGLVGHIRANAPHSHLLEFGTKGHSLAPGSGKRKIKVIRAMRIYGDGDIIRRSAYHRGSPANPFMQRTEQGLPPVVDKELLAVGEAALDNCIRDAGSVFGGR